MKLKDILYKVTINAVTGSTQVSINSLQFDSRKVSFNDCFVAISGTLTHGNEFIDAALSNGALVIVCEKIPINIINGVTYVEVDDTKNALSIMASNYYDNPSQKLNLIGITGTNGKTTIATLLYQLFKNAGFKSGLLSTVKIMVDEVEYPATHTTPDPILINEYLNQMVNQGVNYCFMEVSSHGIHQKRTASLHFKGGVFTNLTQDHLDYHNTFSSYRDVKKLFFDQLPQSSFSLVNVDDKNGEYMLQNTRSNKLTYALKTQADYKCQVLENQFNGLLLKINSNELWSKLIGIFNAYNLLAVYGVAVQLGLEEIEVLRLMSQLESVNGRFQYLIAENNVKAIVDYAHTPDALKNVLETINSIRTGNESLITVVGCGGNRDRSKRPKMGHIATALSNKVIFTSDNPRNEDPSAIIAQMESGVEPQNIKKLLSIIDRFQAIKTACHLAEKNDIILIAGKGHETYQEIQGNRIDFDDFKLVKQLLNEVKT